MSAVKRNGVDEVAPAAVISQSAVFTAPSTLSPAWSLTAANAAAGPYTLRIITWVAAFATPLVLLYQGWTSCVFRKRIGVQHIPDPAHHIPAPAHHAPEPVTTDAR